jgi:hypothetical protein
MMGWWIVVGGGMLASLYCLSSLVLSVVAGRKTRKEIGDWDTTAWAHYNCPKCKAPARKFCRLLPLLGKYSMVRFNVHKERAVKAMLALNGERTNCHRDEFKDRLDLDW